MIQRPSASNTRGGSPSVLVTSTPLTSDPSADTMPSLTSTSTGRPVGASSLPRGTGKTLRISRGSMAPRLDDASDCRQIGRAPWRERVWPYVEIPVVAVSLKKQTDKEKNK